ncbi:MULTISPECIES: hypothetical protein [Pectobacterium]|uniref:hypothetical protein n=1 Tax=Pectobacterium TaxID=122277 RepID=UPI00027E0F1A|nr:MULTISPECIES: hypothetical protein [Pectobacterium]AFR03529.1 hypothetical protein PCC21_021260 [Pectobacterium carotovorum subsp. carotovorum PCC21]UPY93192.1 hypothetical protein MYB54_11195 [Pectobacterium sp. 21LCBS03]GKW00164.1 hypothetical protein PEC301653_32090 [Pectobacterium carotovorum subsp. carotovorum]
MTFSDHKAINFTDPSPHEMEHILYYQLDKRATQDNFDILKLIGDDYKSDNDVTIITDRPKFYEYAKGHYLYDTMEDMKS